MVNIFLFIELLHSANAAQTLEAVKALQMESCKFANVVKLSDEKLVAQLDCEDPSFGDKALLRIVGLEGVVQTNVVAAVTPTKD